MEGVPAHPVGERVVGMPARAHENVPGVQVVRSRAVLTVKRESWTAALPQRFYPTSEGFHPRGGCTVQLFNDSTTKCPAGVVSHRALQQMDGPAAPCQLPPPPPQPPPPPPPPHEELLPQDEPPPQELPPLPPPPPAHQPPLEPLEPAAPECEPLPLPRPAYTASARTRTTATNTKTKIMTFTPLSFPRSRPPVGPPFSVPFSHVVLACCSCMLFLRERGMPSRNPAQAGVEEVQRFGAGWRP